ncbi:MAG TPA: hypothetical protein VHG51_02150, partial [Longimicrobiaceae bacterium]|nr:hypothetical protein [Longimicrobiaceae bacterium]
MTFRRREDRALSLLLATPPEGDGESSRPAGGYRFALLACDPDGDREPRPVAAPDADAALPPGDAVLLLDPGAGDAMLVAGAAIRSIPRGSGGDELLERAAAGAAAWREERLRAWRREQLPEKLIAFS